ncbi:hypothetical protein SDC9_136923 [bioreactor metagenome]|uniref:Uncharacterized protein n=1 Tax=bioreactor metagenome TaxID=1076179 RepID=A0A645DL62_9ZZZZ
MVGTKKANVLVTSVHTASGSSSGANTGSAITWVAITLRSSSSPSPVISQRIAPTDNVLPTQISVTVAVTVIKVAEFTVKV